jgi:hypothetical protein
MSQDLQGSGTDRPQSLQCTMVEVITSHVEETVTARVIEFTLMSNTQQHNSYYGTANNAH